jgi:3D (Asp-Asp-Asp) domain-containing protein
LIYRLRLSAIYIAAAAATVLTVDLAFSNPRVARAEQPTIAVVVARDGVESTVNTTATDVASLLDEQRIALGNGDYLSLLPEAPIENGSRIEIHAARDIPLTVAGRQYTLHTGAPTVAAALLAAGVTLGLKDEVSPDLTAPPDAGVRVVRVKTWTKTDRVAVRGGVRVNTYRYVQRDFGWPTRSLILSEIFQRQPALAMIQSAMQRAFRMVATAYVPWCPGCSGIAKNGMRAGRGVVAVDPSVIPLGTQLYIPGYGRAIAGDTGGSIVGNRIDLGFENYGAAMQFGRREITVYVLR